MKNRSNIKKIIIIAALFTILAASTAFADHPGGFGIGVQAGGIGGWNGGGWGGGALTLKLPSVPIFWAIDFAGWGNYMWLGLAGDYYFIDNQLVKTLNWYLGVGGYVNLGLGNHLGVGVGARLPIGLSWQPIKLLEIYLQIVPSIGLGMYNGVGLGGGIGGNLGIRFWF